MAGVPPKRGEAYTFYVTVTSQANTNVFQGPVTIAAGDFQYSNDGGATFNNPATLPVAVAGNNKVIRVVLSGGEMTPSVGDKILFIGSDAVGAEWQDYFEELTTVATPFDELIAGIWSYATRTLTSFGTLVADIWSYGTRTLTSFGTLVADIVTAILASSLVADIVTAILASALVTNIVNAILASNLVGNIVTALMAIAPVAKALRAVDLELYRGDTWTQPIARLGDISGRNELWIACKDDKDDADAQAVFLISETVGLEVIDGAAATVPANGSITVTDAAVGNITVVLEAEETAKLEATKKMWYDLQMLEGTTVTTLRAGRLMITSDVVRATS